MEITNTSKMLAGVILVTVPTIEYGGSFLLGMGFARMPGAQQSCAASRVAAGFKEV